MCADGLGHISSPQCSPPPLIRLYYTYSRGLGASTASSDRLLPKRQALQNSLQTVLLHGFYPMTQFLESCYREFRRYGKQASKSKYSLLFNAIACVILLLHSTNWSSKNIKGGYEVAYDSANFSVGTAMHRIGG